MEDQTKTTSWQAPPFTASASARMGWIEEQIQEAEGWLEGQDAYRNISKNLKVFDGIFSDSTKSTLSSNFLKYNIRKFVETVSDVREIAQYGSDSPAYKPFAELVNKVSQCVYLESQYPRQLRKALQYATVLGRGYIWPKCKADNYGFGERRIVFEPLGILDVMPVQVPSTNDVQDAYAVTIYEYMPIAEAHGKFPLFQASLKPVDSTRLGSQVQARRADYAERFRYGTQETANRRTWGSLYCEIRYTFIRDISVNRSGSKMPMGERGTSWFYEVPSVGQDIMSGIRDNQPYLRPALAEDCRIYPYLRLIISSKDMTTPMYDGPAFDWHGKMPCVQFDVDDWPWEGVGKSLVQGVASIEQTKRKMERKADQVFTTTLNPPMGYDRSSVGGPKIENFNIFEENVRVGMDGQPRQSLQSLLPEEVRVTELHMKYIELLTKMETDQLGINDLGSLANMKMNVSSETADKMLESIGPLAKAIAGNLESGNAKIGEMLKFMIPQWFDTRRIIQYVGSQSIMPEVFDFDPSSMIPSHMDDEVPPGQIANEPSQYPKVERARRFASNLRLTSIPSTLLKITQMQEQLKWLQLKRGDAPISWSTTLKKLGVENYGDVEGSTEREKWINEKLEDLKLQAMAMAAAQQLGLGGPAEGAAKGGGKGKSGRPPTGKKPPRVVQKGANSGSPRTTVTES